jgi:hypothetical protein
MRLREWVGVAMALALTGFAAAWICLRSLLWAIPLLMLSACGTAGATVVLSTILGSVGGATMGAVVARSAVPPVPTPELQKKSVPEDWRDLEAADKAAAKVVHP